MMGRFGQKTIFGKLKAKVPNAVFIFCIQNNGVQKTLSTNLFDKRMLDLFQFTSKVFTKVESIVNQVFIFNYLKCCYSHFTSQRIATISRTMLTRFDVHHNWVIA